MKAVDEVTRFRQICSWYKKPNAKPIISMPRAQSFNETVSMVLKVYNVVYFLVLVNLPQSHDPRDYRRATRHQVLCGQQVAGRGGVFREGS